MTLFEIVTVMAATVILIAADFRGFATEVAVTDTTVVEATEAGALYVTFVAVWFVNEPHAVPVHPEPESVHVTPWLAIFMLLLETLAITLTVWPCSMVGAEVGLAMATTIDELAFPPHPEGIRLPSIVRIAQNETNPCFNAASPKVDLPVLFAACLTL